MKIASGKKPIAQGDMILVPIKKLPGELTEAKRQNGALVLAHSETGHNHEIRDAEVKMFDKLDRDPFVAYLRVDAAHVDLVHGRPWYTHETWRLPKGKYKIIRQREHAPEGYRRVAD